MTEHNTDIGCPARSGEMVEVPSDVWQTAWKAANPCEEEPTQWEGIVRCKYCGGMRYLNPKPLEQYPPHLYGTHLSNKLHDIVHWGMFDHLTEDDRKELSRKHL